MARAWQNWSLNLGPLKAIITAQARLGFPRPAWAGFGLQAQACTSLVTRTTNSLHHYHQPKESWWTITGISLAAGAIPTQTAPVCPQRRQYDSPLNYLGLPMTSTSRRGLALQGTTRRSQNNRGGVVGEGEAGHLVGSGTVVSPAAQSKDRWGDGRGI